MRPDTGVQPKLHGKEQDQQQPPPEDGHRVPGEGYAHHRVVEHRSALYPGDDPGGQSDDDGKKHGEQGQLDGGRKQGHELNEHRFFGDDRFAQVAVKDALDIFGILDRQGLVQAQLRFQFGVALGVDAPFAGHEHHRVAGDQMDQGKGEQGHADKGGDHHCQASD